MLIDSLLASTAKDPRYDDLKACSVIQTTPLAEYVMASKMVLSGLVGLPMPLFLRNCFIEVSIKGNGGWWVRLDPSQSSKSSEPETWTLEAGFFIKTIVKKGPQALGKLSLNTAGEIIVGDNNEPYIIQTTYTAAFSNKPGAEQARNALQFSFEIMLCCLSLLAQGKAKQTTVNPGGKKRPYQLLEPLSSSTIASFGDIGVAGGWQISGNAADILRKPEVTLGLMKQKVLLLFPQQQEEPVKIGNTQQLVKSAISFSYDGPPSDFYTRLVRASRPQWVTDALFALALMTAKVSFRLIYEGRESPTRRERAFALQMIADVLYGAETSQSDTTLEDWWHWQQLPTDPEKRANVLLAFLRTAWEPEQMRAALHIIQTTSDYAERRRLLVRYVQQIAAPATAYYLLTASDYTYHQYRKTTFRCRPDTAFWTLAAAYTAPFTFNEEELNFLTGQDLLAAAPSRLKTNVISYIDLADTTQEALGAVWAETRLDETIEEREVRDLAVAFTRQMVEEALQSGETPYIGAFMLRKDALPLKLHDLMEIDHIRLIIVSQGIWCSVIHHIDPLLAYSLCYWTPTDDNIALSFSDRQTWAIRAFLGTLWRDAVIVKERAFPIMRKVEGRLRLTTEKNSRYRPPVIVLPRERSERTWGTDEDRDLLRERIQRDTHFVTHHYRRLTQGQIASIQARENALMDGELTPPEGFTYVRDYHTGTGGIHSPVRQLVCKGLYAANMVLSKLAAF